MRREIRLALIVLAVAAAADLPAADLPTAKSLDRSGTQWSPVLEWSLVNPSREGNPHDLVATATFTHRASGATRTTPMFYAADNTWRFRFTGVRTGEWTVVTTSSDSDLGGRRGTVTIRPNPDPNAHGFLRSFGNKWGWQGTNRAFVPQLAMYREPPGFHERPDVVDRDLELLFEGHGFNGVHTAVLCRWFDLEKTRYDDLGDDPVPDPRTFAALELLITKVHAAGGMVHIWAWGDEQRRMTPERWGKDSRVIRRLERTIAARLGPLPGWSMGYGFDLFEWVRHREIRAWRDRMHQSFGWHHFLGGRPGGPRRGTDHSAHLEWNRALDYASYEHHRPTAAVYAAALDATPDRPVFSEDRFRIRDSRYRDKDYDMERTRRGLWHSAMAGGVANIWGHLHNSPDGGWTTGAFPRADQIKTNARFFRERFRSDLVRARLGGGQCLRSPAGKHFLFYDEDAKQVELDLSGMAGEQPAIAVDTQKPYAEIRLGSFQPRKQSWTAPYPSDWAIAVGDFAR